MAAISSEAVACSPIAQRLEGAISTTLTLGVAALKVPVVTGLDDEVAPLIVMLPLVPTLTPRLALLDPRVGTDPIEKPVPADTVNAEVDDEVRSNACG